MEGNDQLLVKIAVFGITVSLVCTLMIGLLLSDQNSDYDYDTITAYRNDLISFSGESMINENPWVLTAVYTPYTGGDILEHIDPDGFLFGESITDYSSIGQSAYIALDSSQKSRTPLNYDPSATVSYTYASGLKWWAQNPFLNVIATTTGLADTRTYSTVEASTWQYTGYRYVFDPTLPFSDTEGTKTSTVDGSLSIVWYDWNNTEGLSGGLVVYGGNVKLANYSATDIISDYNSASGYATTYDFNFNGTSLTLSILFDKEVIDNGTPLMQAFSNGDWTMAISSKSAGNFFDLDNSTSFTVTAGSMIETFIQIYTFSLPSIDNEWMDLVLWLLVGLPMTIAMLCVTLRIMDAIKIIG